MDRLLNMFGENASDRLFNACMSIWFVVTIGVLVFVMVWVVLGLNSDALCDGYEDRRFTCLDYKVNQCIASEQYTRAECITLVGGE